MVVSPDGLVILQVVKSGKLTSEKCTEQYMSEMKPHCSGYHLILVCLEMIGQTNLAKKEENADNKESDIESNLRIRGAEGQAINDYHILE